MPSLPFPSRASQDAHDGFVLPLASAASLVLVLSSLSLQTLALQSRSRVRAKWLQRQQGDALASAAQQLAVQLQGPGQ